MMKGTFYTIESGNTVKKENENKEEKIKSRSRIYSEISPKVEVSIEKIRKK